MFSGHVSGRLTSRGFRDDWGGATNLAIDSLWSSSTSSKIASRSSFSSEAGGGCWDARLSRSMGGDSADNVGYREGPCLMSHLRCTARLFFVMGAYCEHGLVGVGCRQFIAASRSNRRVGHVSGQGQSSRGHRCCSL